ncbi:MAG: endolytic transglycosylase MltG [Ethanoligenens sp.]
MKRHLVWAIATLLCIISVGCSHTTTNKTVSTRSQFTSIRSDISENAPSSTVSKMDSDSFSTVSNADSPAVKQPQAPTQTAPSSTASAREIMNVTIPDGYSVPQIATLLQNAGVCDKTDFLDKVNSYAFKQNCLREIPYDSSKMCYRLEGYLYPDTYQFYKNMDAADVIGRMLNSADQHITGKYNFKTVIIASILEKEVPNTDEMKNAASVILNRLADSKDFPYLGMDSTRHYLTWYIASVSNDLVEKYKNYYNTAIPNRASGLPAGPICSPSARALEAAANPTSTQYLYFFTDANGTTQFSTTVISQ